MGVSTIMWIAFLNVPHLRFCMENEAAPAAAELSQSPVHVQHKVSVLKITHTKNIRVYQRASGSLTPNSASYQCAQAMTHLGKTLDEGHTMQTVHH